MKRTYFPGIIDVVVVIYSTGGVLHSSDTFTVLEMPAYSVKPLVDCQRQTCPYFFQVL